MRLIANKATSETLEAAIAKLERSSYSKGKKAKIQTVMEMSSFGEVYCQYFLADDPQEFRASLEENVQFRQEALEYGIDLNKLAQNREDPGILITIEKEGEKPRRNFTGWLHELYQIRDDVLNDITNAIKQVGAGIEDYDTTQLAREMQEGGVNQEAGNNPHFDQITGGWDYDAHLYTIPELAKHLEFAIEGGLEEARKPLQKILRTYKEIFKNPYLNDIEQAHKEDSLTVDYVDNMFGQKTEFFAAELQDRIQRLLLEFINAIKFTEEVPSLRKFEDQAENLYTHFEEYVDKHKVIASRMKNVTEARYTVQLEQLLPDDVIFGNDGGCCIAVGQNDLGNGEAVPFYQLDQGTLIFGIYQHVGTRKPRRVGMVLSFITVDDEDDPILLTNSYELSESWNPLQDEEFSRLVEHITSYLGDFAHRAGCKRITLGTHNYNTAINYAGRVQTEKAEPKELMKLPDLEDTPVFYSEVLTEDGFSNNQVAYVV